MTPVPPMVIPSAFSTFVFLCVVVGVAVMAVWGSYLAGRGMGEATAYSRHMAVRMAVGVAVWMVVTALVPASGVLEAPGMPPRAAVFLGILNISLVVLAFSRVGTRLAHGLPIAALVGFHAFRLPLELVLHRWYLEGTLPLQMTYEGRNLDIVSGILGLAVGLWLWRRGPSRALVWAFNIVGFALLINVAAIAVLSSPFPFRVFTEEPAVQLVFHAPYSWIVSMCVAPALAGHILIFRWLSHTRASK